MCTGIKENSGVDKNTGEKISGIKKDAGDEQSIHGEINVDTGKIQRVLSEMYELMNILKNWVQEGRRSPSKRLVLLTYILDAKEIVLGARKMDVIQAEKLLKNYTKFSKLLKEDGIEQDVGNDLATSLVKDTQQLIMTLDTEDIMRMKDSQSHVMKNINRFIYEEVDYVEKFLLAQKNNQISIQELRNF